MNSQWLSPLVALPGHLRYIYIFIVLFSEQEGLNRNEKESKGSLLTISLYALRSEGSTLKAVDWLVNLIHDCI